MKKSVALLSILAALSTGAALNAQSLALPKTEGTNFTIQFGPTYLRATSDTSVNGIPTGSGSLDFYGATVDFGWRFDRHNMLQLETGILGGSDSASSAGATVTQDSVSVPIVVSYSFCIPFSQSDQFELRISPTAGAVYISTKLGVTSGPYSYSNTDSWLVPAYGGGLGFTYHINRKIYIDLAYRYLRLGDMKMNFAGLEMKQSSNYANSFSAAIGFKF